MRISTAAGSDVVIETDGQKLRLPVLCVADLGAMEAELGGDDAKLVTLFELEKWVNTRTGSVFALTRSFSRAQPPLDQQAIEERWSIADRVQIARALFYQAVFNGEEESAPQDRKKKASHAIG